MKMPEIPEIKFEKPTKEKVKHWLILIFVPFLLLIDKTGKDKSGHILTGIFALIVLIFLGGLIFSGKANFICIIGWIALNVWGWMMYIMEKNDDFLK